MIHQSVVWMNEHAVVAVQGNAAAAEGRMNVWVVWLASNGSFRREGALGALLVTSLVMGVLHLLGFKFM